MAKRGVRPKPARLRLLLGVNPTRHGSEDDLRQQIATAGTFAPLDCPKHLTAEGRKAWTRYIAPAAWLDASKEPAAIAFCALWTEFMLAPTMFPAAKHKQMRAYMGELGLDRPRR